MPVCPINPASEQVADFIYHAGSSTLPAVNLEQDSLCYDTVSREYAVLYLPLDTVTPISLSKYDYSSIPKLYTLLDTSSMEASGILPVFQQPALGGQGRGVLIGMIDTGIDYQNPLFLQPDGTTRILGIWDQNIPEGPDEIPPGVRSRIPYYMDIQYGTAYTADQINEALRSDDPLQIVPSTDTDGHGTFMAGIAAGGATASGDFTGAAPQASLGVVKLKPAKRYLRDFYLIQEDADAYQENDIMMGIKYLYLLSSWYNMPLVLCIPMGTNWGSHEGASPLGYTLQSYSQFAHFISVVAGGNEAGLGHHYLGIISSGRTSEDVEIRVAPGERGFVAEFWADVSDLYTVGFISPSGENISRIPLSLGRDSRISFLLEPTVITVNYVLIEGGSGRQLIFFRFQDPTPGIWRIRVYNTLFLVGRYHIWLPVESFISPDTVFLKPDPDTTITNPGNSPFPMTISAYDHRDGSIYLHSSRGYTINGQIKPDLAAPGVNVYGPALPPLSWRAAGEGPDSAPPMTRRTGSSVSAAHVAGAAANLLAWGLLQGNDLTISNASVRGYLIRGADRNPAYQYPNREFGYGTLDLYQSFLQLRE
ncbi:MAG: S8 family peptidase [Lachnospiraceae bacterium]|nr:S8 family peptidase [Lachnospiraceae bacterium]